MTDTDRTTINIGKEEHRATRDVKADYGDSWTDVLRFYREHRSELSVSDTQGIDPDDLAARIVDQIGADVGGPQVDDSEIARAVARELDYAHLASKVSEQVVNELR